MTETELLQKLAELKAAHGQTGQDNTERITAVQKELLALRGGRPGAVQVGSAADTTIGGSVVGRDNVAGNKIEFHLHGGAALQQAQLRARLQAELGESDAAAVMNLLNLEAQQALQASEARLAQAQADLKAVESAVMAQEKKLAELRQMTARVKSAGETPPAPKTITLKLTKDLSLTLTQVPAGAFYTLDKKKVQLDGHLYMGQTTITNRLYAAFCETTREHWSNKDLGPALVSHDGAMSFSSWAAELTGVPLRVPSEPEWSRALEALLTPQSVVAAGVTLHGVRDSGLEEWTATAAHSLQGYFVAKWTGGKHDNSRSSKCAFRLCASSMPDVEAKPA